MADQYKKEIEEILTQAGEFGASPNISPRRPALFKFIWYQLARSFSGGPLFLPPGRVLLAAITLLLLALVTGMGLLAWVGLILFIVGYAMFFVRPRKIEKRWRGKPVDDE